MFDVKIGFFNVMKVVSLSLIDYKYNVWGLYSSLYCIKSTHYTTKLADHDNRILLIC